MQRLRAIAGAFFVLTAMFAGLGIARTSMPAGAVGIGVIWVVVPPTTDVVAGRTFTVVVRSGDPALPPTVTASGACTAATVASAPGAPADTLTVLVTTTAKGTCTVTAEVARSLCPAAPATNIGADPSGSSSSSSSSSSLPKTTVITTTTTTTIPDPPPCPSSRPVNVVDEPTPQCVPPTATCGIDYIPVTPTRVLETRNAARSGGRDITPVNYDVGRRPTGGLGSIIRVKIAGRTHQPTGVAIPADAVAVAINVAGVDAESGYLRVWDCAAIQPDTSNVNLVALPPGSTAPANFDADARANLVITGVDAATGDVCIVSMKSTEIFVDLIGYFPKGSPYAPLAPKRVVETRPEFTTLVNHAPLVAGQAVELPLERNGGAVSAGAKYVALNVTGEKPAVDGTIRVYDCAAGPVDAQSITVEHTVEATPLLVIAKVNATKTVCVVATTGVNLIVDLFGEFGATTRFQTLAPVALFNAGAFGEQETRPIQLSGTANVGAADVDAAYLKITSTKGAINGFVTVYPCNDPRPGTSSLNVAQFGPASNQFPTASNVVFAQTNAAGATCVFTQHPATLTIELLGFWPRVPPPAS